jgi:hypothetical protein
VSASDPPIIPEVIVAERALAAAPAGCRYARADLVAHDDGNILLSELELVEPSLYFSHGPAALKRFVRMIECASGAVPAF